MSIVAHGEGAGTATTDLKERTEDIVVRVCRRGLRDADQRTRSIDQDGPDAPEFLGNVKAGFRFSRSGRDQELGAVEDVYRAVAAGVAAGPCETAVGVIWGCESAIVVRHDHRRPGTGYGRGPRTAARDIELQGAKSRASVDRYDSSTFAADLDGVVAARGRDAGAGTRDKHRHRQANVYYT